MPHHNQEPILTRKLKVSKNPVGRPSEYYPEICQQLLDYFDREPETAQWYQNTPGEQGGDTMRAAGCEFPTIEGFCAKYMISKVTFHNWKEKHQELMNAYEIARQTQQHILLTNGLKGHYNGSFAKFVAMNFFDMKDKAEVDHKSSDKSMSPVFNMVEKKKEDGDK